MQACDDVCREVFGTSELLRVPTHYYDESSEHVSDDVKLLCGTNILYKNMEGQQQLALPKNLANYRNICLLGVGLSDIGIDEESSRYTRWLYSTLLSRKLIHSVRDEKAKRFLNSIGFDNVVNTACPTMWKLTKELQDSIPRQKASTVITSITDYCFDPAVDKMMLEQLKREYERVVIWVQGSHDVDWCLQNIVELGDYELIGPKISELDAVLDSGEVDYIGTRLHAGIRALNHRVRTLIVTVDNRARQIGADTGLPVIERASIPDGALLDWIHAPYICDIKLPEEAIKRWKAQFSLNN